MIGTINEYKIDLPWDMSIQDDGMFQHLSYRGVMIHTFEDQNPDVLYRGPFAIGLNDNLVRVETLDDVRTTINARIPLRRARRRV
jgi:hypothetical protein